MAVVSKIAHHAARASDRLAPECCMSLCNYLLATKLAYKTPCS